MRKKCVWQRFVNAHTSDKAALSSEGSSYLSPLNYFDSLDIVFIIIT